MCYSHLGNGVRNGAISILQWGFINDYCKVNAVGKWGKNHDYRNGICTYRGAVNLVISI